MWRPTGGGVVLRDLAQLALGVECRPVDARRRRRPQVGRVLAWVREQDVLRPRSARQHQLKFCKKRIIVRSDRISSSVA